MRVDFSTPMNKDGTIADDSRIKATLPSIQYVIKHKGKLILLSHLGRPKGAQDPTLSLKPIAKRLSELLGRPVQFCTELKEAKNRASHLKEGEVLLLENLRFHKGEEEPEKDPHFAVMLSELGELYVNDAFGAAHRAHSSTAMIAKYFPKASAAGFLMEKEVAALSSLLTPKHPFFVVMGGAKISTKIGVIENLLQTVDRLFLGGGMAYPFLKAKGVEVGASLIEPGSVELAEKIMQKAKKKIELPVDLVIAESFSAEAKRKIVSVEEGVLPSWQGMDIGPKTVQLWKRAFSEAATIFWNGPLGVYEMAPFMKGTKEIAQALSQCQAKVVVGGGDSAAAVAQLGLESSFHHVSMGGGAALEFLEFGHLPGIDCLTDVR